MHCISQCKLPSLVVAPFFCLHLPCQCVEEQQEEGMEAEQISVTEQVIEHPCKLFALARCVQVLVEIAVSCFLHDLAQELMGFAL